MNFNQYCTDGVALYDDFAQMVADCLENAIRKETKLRLQAALYRAKAPASLQKKLERDGALERPDIEEVIKDLAGCRLIFYTNSDVDGFRGSDILHGHFKIDWDRTKIHYPVPLATARPKLFSSHNFVVELGEAQATQPELARYKGLRCEVQVQTILNHAWSEMEHDILYKKPNLDGFGGQVMLSIDERLQKIMREYLIPAGHEFQKVVNDFQKLLDGKALLDEHQIERLTDAKNNNELFDYLTNLNESVLPYFDDPSSIQSEVRKAVVVAVQLAQTRAAVPIQTSYGNFDGRTSDLVVEVACEIVDKLRYLGEEAVTETLEALCTLYKCATSYRQRQLIVASAKCLAGYSRDIWNQAGPTVQIILVERILAIGATAETGCREVIVEMLEQVLSPEIKGSSSTYNAITLTTAAVTPMDSLVAVRAKAISLLLEVLADSKTNQEKRTILLALAEASRTPSLGSYSNALVAVTYRDTARIIRSVTDLLPTLGHMATGKFEHDCLWHFRRSAQLPTSMADDKEILAARDEMRQSIWAFREQANSDRTFVIFKTLVGYDSVFPPAWDSDEFDIHGVDGYRTKAVTDLVGQVTQATVDEWFGTVTTIANSETDDPSVFHSFKRFIEQLAAIQPDIALTYIDRMDAGLARFLASFLCGLDKAGKGDAVRLLTKTWVREGCHIEQILCYCAESVKLDLTLLEEATAKAIEFGKDFEVLVAVEASVGWCGEETERLVERVLIPGIRYLTAKNQFRWVRALWPRKEGRELIKVLAPTQDDALLEFMVPMLDIDHYAEEILKEIGAKDLRKLLNFFGRRLDYENRSGCRRYDPIPFEFHVLGKILRSDSDLLVNMALDWYRADTKLFGFRGGRIISATFPTPDTELLHALAGIVAKGTPEAYKFVLQVLQNFKGEVVLYPLLQAIVVAVPGDSEILSGVMVVLDATGTMTGEFGIVETLVRKRGEIQPWLDDPRERIKAFASKRVASLERQIAEEQRRAEQSLEQRKLDYGK